MEREKWFSIGALVALCGLGPIRAETSFLEKFALDEEREDALKMLRPGSEDFYYYTCLHYQLSGDRAAFDKKMDDWEDAYTFSDRRRELRRRQAFLDFTTKPENTWTFLTETERIAHFDHRSTHREADDDAVSVIDESFYDISAFLSVAGERRNTTGAFSDAGLAFAISRGLSPAERRAALNRLQTGNIEGLPELIAADLQWKPKSGGRTRFGSMKVHALLDLRQLDALQAKVPSLLDNETFVFEVLARLQPDEETDVHRDRIAAQAYYRRLHKRVAPLSKKFTSLKASVLYRLLVVNQRLGQFDETLFLEYLRYPRKVRYVARPLQEDWKQRRLPEVNFDYRGSHGFAVPPIGNEETLVLDYLEQLLATRESVPAELARLFHGPWLEKTMARIQIRAGKDPDGRWARLLSKAEFDALNDQVEIRFAPQNPTQFFPGDKVKLAVDVKNVPNLLVKIYEIQAFNYYKMHKAMVNQAVELNGMTATHERSHRYTEEASVRVRRTLDLPEVSKRGVYVVELIGNGVSSRAVVMIGKFEYLTMPTPTGQAVLVLNEQGQMVRNARVWMSGREYTPDERGLILLPYSAHARETFAILRQGEFASPVRFAHMGEQYTFRAGLAIDPEGMGRNRTASLFLRPDLRVNGIPVPLANLTDVNVSLRATDAKGTKSFRSYKPQFEDNTDWAAQFWVGEDLRTLDVWVKAKVKRRVDGEEVELRSRHRVYVNQGRSRGSTEEVFLVPTKDSWFVEVRGVNGELIPNVPLRVQLSHPYFRAAREMQVVTDEKGRVTLGRLEDIASIKITGPNRLSLSKPLQSGTVHFPRRIHATADEPIEIPFPFDPHPEKMAVATLVHLRSGRVLRYVNDAITIRDGLLSIQGLQPGIYLLRLHAMNQVIEIHVSNGVNRHGFAVGDLRRLQLGLRRFPAVGPITRDGQDLVVKVHNANATTRLLVGAGRYLDGKARVPRGLGYPDPVVKTVRYPRVHYVSGRNIGDEYRYVLDRQHTTVFAGSSLDRPGLLLTPWALRDTEAMEEELRKNEAYRLERQKMETPERAISSSGVDPQSGEMEGIFGGVSFEDIPTSPISPRERAIDAVTENEQERISPEGEYQFSRGRVEIWGRLVATFCQPARSWPRISGRITMA